MAIQQRFEQLDPFLDERSRRVFAAAEANCMGYGGVSVLATITGLARSTIRRGQLELASGALIPGRIRCVGGGRKKAQCHKQKSNKTDAKDAEHILEIVRAYKLAGNTLPEVNVPCVQQRDDQEIVRTRHDMSSKQTRFKAQIKTLLKRNGVTAPAELGAGWTKKWRAFLDRLSSGKELRLGARLALKLLLMQLDNAIEVIAACDEAISKLGRTQRHQKQVKALTAMAGVGVFTALTFLTEMGDLKRFKNRRQVGSYAGLAPTSHESGNITDRKGHITRQGPSRLRRVLCQAVWARVRSDPNERACR